MAKKRLEKQPEAHQGAQVGKATEADGVASLLATIAEVLRPIEAEEAPNNCYGSHALLMREKKCQVSEKRKPISLEGEVLVFDSLMLDEAELAGWQYFLKKVSEQPEEAPIENYFHQTVFANFFKDMSPESIRLHILLAKVRVEQIRLGFGQLTLSEYLLAITQEIGVEIDDLTTADYGNSIFKEFVESYCDDQGLKNLINALILEKSYGIIGARQVFANLDLIQEMIASTQAMRNRAYNETVRQQLTKELDNLPIESIIVKHKQTERKIPFSSAKNSGLEFFLVKHAEQYELLVTLSNGTEGTIEAIELKQGVQLQERTGYSINKEFVSLVSDDYESIIINFDAQAYSLLLVKAIRIIKSPSIDFENEIDEYLEEQKRQKQTQWSPSTPVPSASSSPAIAPIPTGSQASTIPIQPSQSSHWSSGYNYKRGQSSENTTYVSYSKED